MTMAELLSHLGADRVCDEDTLTFYLPMRSVCSWASLKYVICNRRTGIYTPPNISKLTRQNLNH